MNKKDLILDFTSLLDVTLIIIFFFVLFSHLDSEQMRKETDDKINELNAAIMRADESREMADNMSKDLENEIQLVKDASERNGENVSALVQFDNSKNLKIILDMTSSGWGVRIIRKINDDDTKMKLLTNGDHFADELRATMEEFGYNTDHAIFCDFVYDGSVGGTRAAYNTITDVLKEVNKDYRYLYISETNLSVGSDLKTLGE